VSVSKTSCSQRPTRCLMVRSTACGCCVLRRATPFSPLLRHHCDCYRCCLVGSFSCGVSDAAQPLADIDEFCGKIRACKDAQVDPNFNVVARVEALIAGWPLEVWYTECIAAFGV
jgi:hypothetical protein